jgi:hypothetical protein
MLPASVLLFNPETSGLRRTLQLFILYGAGIRINALKILSFLVVFNAFLITANYIHCKHMYAETGQVCKSAGNYKCFGHPNHIITMEVGDIFPKCGSDKAHDALWILQTETSRHKASQDSSKED